MGIYEYTFIIPTREGKMDVMSRVSNLMIWSDNDVANDFTTLKNAEGEQVLLAFTLVQGLLKFNLNKDPQLQ